MAFSEKLKAKIRVQAAFRCCLCETDEIEIHHIVPQADGGPDNEDNAAPLCPNCHERYGANPEKRKRIRERRDWWYQVVESRYPLVAGLATSADINRFMHLLLSHILSPSENQQIRPEENPFSFTRHELVHPRVVKELFGWLSDSSSTVTSIDVRSANRSNQFHGDVEIRKIDGRTWVNWNGKRESFSYSHVSRTPSGLEIVECYDSGGGSGVFGRVGLFAWRADYAYDENFDSGFRLRRNLTVVGSVSLGDRYSGSITCESGTLRVGPDEGWFGRGKETERKLVLENYSSRSGVDPRDDGECWVQCVTGITRDADREKRNLEQKYEIIPGTWELCGASMTRERAIDFSRFLGKKYGCETFEEVTEKMDGEDWLVYRFEYMTDGRTWNEMSRKISSR